MTIDEARVQMLREQANALSTRLTNLRNAEAALSSFTSFITEATHGEHAIGLGNTQDDAAQIYQNRPRTQTAIKYNSGNDCTAALMVEFCQDVRNTLRPQYLALLEKYRLAAQKMRDDLLLEVTGAGEETNTRQLRKVRTKTPETTVTVDE